MNRSTPLKAVLMDLVLLTTALPATGAERPDIIFIRWNDAAALGRIILAAGRLHRRAFSL